MAESQLAFVDVRGGMNASDPPHKIATNQVSRMVNCDIVEGLPTTRPGGRVAPFSGTSAEFVGAAPLQGSIFFNPAKGQGGIVLSEANPALALAIGGRKMLVNLDGRRGRAKAVVRDISGGFFNNAQNHLAWLSQWENLLVIADGEGKTFIYDPDNGPSLSRGYNEVEKLKSEIPNGATVLAYVHARGVAVVNSRQILVGDSLHRTNLTTSANLKEFTEQVYWATGQHFVPPSAMGGITAAGPLPLKNTNNGQGPIIFHCEDGGFSIMLNEYPRSTWADKQMVKIAFMNAGATGPYALAVSDGDQIFRTRKGVQTYRSAAATADVEGNPEQTLSSEVDIWFAADYPRWLRFASVCVWSSMRKILFTVAPVVSGSFRWHRGIISRNTDTSPTSPNTPPVWEGLWTLPPQMAGVVQLVNGLFDGEERQFAWVRGTDGKNRLVEFSTSFRDDVLEDGTLRPIRAQVITRAIDAGKWYNSREFTDAKLYLRNIAGRVRWGVWFRPEESPSWKFLRAGVVTVPDFSDDDFDLAAPVERSIAIPLGRLPTTCTPDSTTKANESRSMQFLVRWEGYCSLEGVKVEHGDQDLAQGQLDKGKFDVTFKKASAMEYDDYEYSQTEEALWISEETTA